MPRGRPRKVKVEETKIEEIEETKKIEDAKVVNIPTPEKGKKPAQEIEKNIPANFNITAVKSTKDARPTCQCCGKKIDSSVRTLNLTYLTSIAPYRFEIENENGLVKVCGECALELSKVIEMWMIEKGAKKKWGLEE